jgi:uncharacterized membrane protein
MFHWRLVVGAVVGSIGAVAVKFCGAPATLAALVGWNLAVAAYMALTWRLFLTASEADVRTNAARQDERGWVILLMIVVAVAASVAAIVSTMLSVKHLPQGEQAPAAGLAALTLAASWGMLQTVFAVHYAHAHFNDVAERGESAGIAFPGDPARSYMDFAYLAICVGATCQVSDPTVTDSRLRNLVTAHAVTAFFYNTAVLALGINILASLLSG